MEQSVAEQLVDIYRQVFVGDRLVMAKNMDSVNLCLLAKGFNDLPAGIKFVAIYEGWSVERIRTEIINHFL